LYAIRDFTCIKLYIKFLGEQLVMYIKQSTQINLENRQQQHGAAAQHTLIYRTINIESNFVKRLIKSKQNRTETHE